MQNTHSLQAMALRELSEDECVLVAGGLSAGGAETLPGGIVEPNPVGSPVPPLGTVSGG
jgi:hypothetical protein